MRQITPTGGAVPVSSRMAVCLSTSLVFTTQSRRLCNVYYYSTISFPRQWDFFYFYAEVTGNNTDVIYQSDHTCKDGCLAHVPSSQTCISFSQCSAHRLLSPPLPASYKHGVSRVYARPRPLGPAGGNTLDDITAARTHWPWDVAHLPNRLPVKWRQPRPVPLTFSGVGVAERLPTSEPAGFCPMIGCWRWKWASVAERKGRGRAVCKGHRCVGCATYELTISEANFLSMHSC